MPSFPLPNDLESTGLAATGGVAAVSQTTLTPRFGDSYTFNVMYARYLEILDLTDLGNIGDAAGIAVGHAEALDRFRAEPHLIGAALNSDATFDLVLGNDHQTGPQGRVSSLLPLAISVHRLAKDLVERSFIVERHGASVYVPVVQGSELGRFAAQSANLTFLVELLGSFGPTGRDEIARPGRGVRELHELAAALGERDIREHPGLLRRLGDLALLATGIHAATAQATTATTETIDQALATLPNSQRSAGVAASIRTGLAGGSIFDLFWLFGPVWYRRAARASTVPAITAPLESVARHFDEASDFLDLLVERLAVQELDTLLPSVLP